MAEVYGVLENLAKAGVEPAQNLAPPKSTPF
jgi:hypothetical protein